MTTPASTRSGGLPYSPIRKFVPFAQEAEACGKKVYYLNIGQPDIPTPVSFWDGLQAIQKKVLEYDFSQGNPLLIDALKDYYNAQFGVDLAHKNIQITNGGSEALIFSFFASCNEGDEILILDPTYTNYISFAHMMKVTLKALPLSIENGFHFDDAYQLAPLLTKKTKAILLTNPCNPTGRIFTQKERESIVKFASDNNLFLIVDEVYRNFVYDGKQETTFLEYAKEYDNIIVIDSLSKRYSVTGARIGALITYNSEVLETSLKLAQARLASGTLDQVASAHMVRCCPQADLDAIVIEYQRRRDVLYSSFQNIPGAFCHKPEGAFYTVVKLPVKDAEHFAQWLLESYSHKGATTFVAPARGFYVTPGKGLDEVRIAYVLNCDAIKSAVKVIEEALKVYKG